MWLCSLALAAEPLTWSTRLGAAGFLDGSVPDRVAAGAAVRRGAFFGDLGASLGFGQGPSGLDQTLLTIAYASDPASDFSRVAGHDRWSLALTAGLGEPTRVPGRPVGSPFLALGAEVRGALRTEYVYQDPGMTRVVEEDRVVEVGPLLQGGFVVGVGRHAGARVVVTDRVRPSVNDLDGPWIHEPDLALDLTWTF